MDLAPMAPCTTPAFAVLRSLQTTFFIRKLSVSLGKGDKRGVDLHIGDCGDISRTHALIQFNWSIRRFELLPIGKRGVVINGLLYTVGSVPIPLDSNDMIEIPCGENCRHEFLFLLALSSTDRGPYDVASYRLPDKFSGRDAARAAWSVSERDRFLQAIQDFGYYRPAEVKYRAELHKRVPYEVLQFAQAFIAGIREHCHGTLLSYLDSIIGTAKPVSIPEVISSWRQLRKSSASWARRLRSLHLLLEMMVLHEECGFDPVQGLAPSPITLPCPQWTLNDDRALLIGAYRHGYTQLDHILGDKDLPFDISRDNGFPSHQSLLIRLDQLLSDNPKTSTPTLNPGSLKIKTAPPLRLSGEEKLQMFTKRQRVDFMRALMIHGVSRQPDGTIDWSTIRRREGLRDKLNSSLARAFQTFCDESSKLTSGVDETNALEFMDGDNGVMTRVVAKKFRKRISLMHDLRTHVLAHPDVQKLVLVDHPPPPTTSLPSWWQNTHDLNLLKGIGRHGIGQWQEIFSDDSLEWPDPQTLQADPAKSEPLFNRARQLTKLYASLCPKRTMGPFDIRPEDYIDPPEMIKDTKRRRSSDESDVEELIAPKIIRISRASMTVVYPKLPPIDLSA